MGQHQQSHTADAGLRAVRRAAGMACLIVVCQAQADDSVPAAVADGPTRLEPVIVSAQKVDRDLQQVPAAISAVTRRELDDYRIESLQRISDLTPGLEISDNSFVRTVFVRGVGGGGRQAGFDTRAGVYVDGVYVGQPPIVDTLLLDLQRVEVLRGPQGTLFGQNSSSGAISLVTRAPGRDYSARALASVGNYDDRRGAFSVDAPLVSNQVLLNVSAAGHSRDGYTLNVFNGEHPDDAGDLGGRVRLRLKPDPFSTIDLAVDGGRTSTHQVTGEVRTDVLGTGPAANPEPFVTAFNTPEQDVSRTGGAAVTVNSRVGATTLTSITAYRLASRDWTVDLDHTASDINLFSYHDRYRDFSQELRLSDATPEETLHYVAGIYLLQGDASSGRLVQELSRVGLVSTTLKPGDQALTYPDVKTSSWAAFGTVDWTFVPRWTLSGGLRLTRTVKELDFSQDGSRFTALGGVTVQDYRDRFTETAADPSLSLQWQPAAPAMLYAKVSRGSKSGGYNADLLLKPRLVPERLRQETVTSYEAGTKLSAFDRRLRANLAVFYADYHDYQVSQFLRQGPILVNMLSNAGKVRTYGPELSVEAAPVPGLQLMASTAWLHAVYAEFRNADATGTDFSGRRTEYAPRWTASMLAGYQHPTPWFGAASAFIRGTYSYRSDMYTQPSNAPVYRTDNRSLLGGQLGFVAPGERWQVALYGENLLNEVYDESLQPASRAAIVGRYGAPRTYGVDVRLRWR